MSKQLQLDVAQLTDVGRKRPHNEDNMAYVIPTDPTVMAKKGALFIVADGMGGHAAGEVASEIAVDTVSNVYYQDDSDDVVVSLLYAIRRANTLIHQRAAENMLRSGMGTTCVTAVLCGSTAYIANVGDSRAYLVRHGHVRQVSQDHSWVEEQVRAGMLTREQARSHAQRNVITRCLGTQPEVEIDVFSEQLEEGDSLVLCTDGLSGLIADEELCAIVDQYMPQESVYHLVERANEHGGSDNITAIVMRVEELGWDPYPPGVHRPVYAGGHSDSMDVDTAVLGRIAGPGHALPSRPVDGRAPTSPLLTPRSSGPLVSANSRITPPPASQHSWSKRERGFYPLLALLMVFLVVLLGSGAYYFLWQQQEKDVENTLKVAKDTIQSANTVAHSNPSDALKKLAGVQQSLKRVATANLNTTQQQQVKRLLNDELTMAVNEAIAQYNQQFAILALPCLNSQVTRLSNGTVNTQPGSVVAVRNGQKLFFYALGEDRHLYQLDSGQHTLGKEIPLDKKALSMTTTSLAADDARVLVLTGENTNNYTLQLFIPNANGDGGKIVTQSLSDWTKDGHKPMFLTTSGPDIYVVLTMEGVSTTMIVDFTLEQDAFKPGPHIATLSTSHSIVSAAALSHNRLFLLLNDGAVQSLQLVGTQQSLVFVNGPIATPLQTAGDFTPNQIVPTPSSLVSTNTTAAEPVLLSIPTAVFLAAGMVGNTEHLYVVDRSYHRVVDLVPDSTATNKTTTPTPMPTSDNAGGGIAKQVTMQLFQQYASLTLLAIVKSISADPTKSGFYLLAQSDQSQGNVLNLIPADTTQEGNC